MQEVMPCLLQNSIVYNSELRRILHPIRAFGSNGLADLVFTSTSILCRIQRYPGHLVRGSCEKPRWEWIPSVCDRGSDPIHLGEHPAIM